ncbi:hypothetical protein L3X38_032573 [Prunus dulcis]|uniref:RNase H type-1 domain-containing protein n=1 Tax=Prunus dulcis TaxID=3755 RepID=A0AAD4VFF4_PRUDU|nr:hypothetical protein L3X38_032573 [Prunus dulcis]
MLILSLVVLVRKLRSYYQIHWILVMTNFPLRSILHSLGASNQLIKMGYRTQLVQPCLPAEDCYKSPSFSIFHCTVYSISRKREIGHEKQGKFESKQHLLYQSKERYVAVAHRWGIKSQGSWSRLHHNHPIWNFVGASHHLDKVQMLLKEFPTFTIQQVPRAKNTHADALASLGS